jgi:hypothetical protein
MAYDGLDGCEETRGGAPTFVTVVVVVTPASSVLARTPAASASSRLVHGSGNAKESERGIDPAICAGVATPPHRQHRRAYNGEGLILRMRLGPSRYTGCLNAEMPSVCSIQFSLY